MIAQVKVNTLDKVQPDYQQAAHFLNLLDEDAESFTFQTFDDNADRKDRSLTSILNGSLEKHWNELVRLNAAGAGVYVTVNETNLNGRKKEDIIRIRASWQEADRSDTPPLLIQPHIEIESSQGKYHRYILTDSTLLEEFMRVQQRMVKDFGSDPNPSDISRVLRLPGFHHQKVDSRKGLTGNKHLVRITHESGEQSMGWEAVKQAFQPANGAINTDSPKGTPKPLDNPSEVKSALDSIPPNCDYTTWLNIGMALHSTGAEEQAFTLWDEWSATGVSYREGETAYKWNGFTGDKGITLKTLFQYAIEHGWSSTTPREPKLQALVNDLAKLTPLDYDQERENKAKEFGVRVSTLDKEVAKARGDTAENNHDSVVEELDPWPEPVDGVALLDSIADSFGRLSFCQPVPGQ